MNYLRVLRRFKFQQISSYFTRKLHLGKFGRVITSNSSSSCTEYHNMIFSFLNLRSFHWVPIQVLAATCCFVSLLGVLFLKYSMLSVGDAYYSPQNDPTIRIQTSLLRDPTQASRFFRSAVTICAAYFFVWTSTKLSYFLKRLLNGLLVNLMKLYRKGSRILEDIKRS